jgi:hypothetical protein
LVRNPVAQQTCHGDEAKIVITVKCESLGASKVGIVASFDQRKQNKHAEPVKS